MPAISERPTLPVDPVDETAPNPLIDLLARWLQLAAMERCVFTAITEELTDTSGLIERSTLDLSQRFRDLAAAAAVQTGRVQQIAAIAETVDLGEQRLPTAEVVGIVEAALVQAMDGLQRVSGQATTMVHALDAVVADVAHVEQCVTKIEQINSMARYVALNAAIEANRGASAGGTFKVIAHELKELSLQTDSISRQVRERVGGIASAIRHAHRRLQDVASGGTVDHDSTRRQLDAVLAGLVAQNQQLGAVLEDATHASDDIAATIGQLIMGAQFQDRATQHLSHAADALAVIGDVASALRDETCAAVPAVEMHDEVDSALVDRLVGGQTLSAVRRRFLDRLAGGGVVGEAPEMEQAGAGDIELF